MRYEEVRAFLAVAEHGSFVSAAASLGVARSSLHRQIEALEQRTGLVLLERSHSGVALTVAGREFLARGRDIEQQFASLVEEVRGVGTAPHGVVRLLLPVGLPTSALVGVTSLVRAAWPGVCLDARFADAPLAGSLADVEMVVWFGPPDDAPRGAWESHVLQDTRARLVATADYLARHGTPASADDLDQHDLYVWVPRHGGEPAITVAGQSRSVRAVMTSSNVDLLHECAGRSLGIAWVPDGGIAIPGRAPLVPVLDGVCAAPLAVHLAVPRGLATIPRLRVFLDNVDRLRSVAVSFATTR